ncbi:MAG: hypothetical protein SFW67_13810 [Myxococcaceae bacterium]|nr:hypothetical protein [Myxococcaceae bacterium]
MKALRAVVLAAWVMTACDFDALYDERCRTVACDEVADAGRDAGSGAGAGGGSAAGGSTAGGGAGGSSGDAGGGLPRPMLQVQVTTNDGGALRDGGLRSDGGAVLAAEATSCVRAVVVASAGADAGLVSVVASSGLGPLPLYEDGDCTRDAGMGRRVPGVPFFLKATAGDAGAFGHVDVLATAAGFDSSASVVLFRPASLSLPGEFEMEPDAGASRPLEFHDARGVRLASLETLAVSCPPIFTCGLIGPLPNPAVFDAGARSVTLTVTASQVCLNAVSVACSVDLGGPLEAGAPVRVCYRGRVVSLGPGGASPCCAGFVTVDAGVRCD